MARRSRRTAALVVGAVLLVTTAAPVEAAPGGREAADWVVDLDATALGELLAQGRVTSVGLVKAYRARIDAYEEAYADQPGVNAVIREDPQALAVAARLDAERRHGHVRGPLHGIPILLKDNYDTADLPTSNGSLALRHWRTADDAEQVERLRDAGAIVVAKTNLHEFASGVETISSLGGQTRNPYDQTRNPGGSSGGTGAGLAAAFGAVGLGSDTCGSVRSPAAHNSLVGLRPSLGLSSRFGIAPLSYTQDVGGPMAKSVRDVALVLDATVGYDPDDPSTAASIGRTPRTYTTSLRDNALAGARIGVFTDFMGATEPERPTTSLVRAATGDMAGQGATIVDVPPQPALLAAVEASWVINDEHERDLNRYLARPGSRFPHSLARLEPPRDVVTLADIVTSGQVTPTVLVRLKDRLGRSTGPQDAYHERLARRAEAQRLLATLMAEHDLDALVYPTVPQQAALIGQPQPSGRSCALAANTGFPALTVPAGFTPDGMPVGVELLGTPFSEPTLLGLGFDYEQATRHRRPPTSTPPLA
ncbi:amidase family protein [Saccharothrix violaceirubra]|uniref:Asp-tRNA(Asn)/Glu-tRNA(Gln) amidotransferase A subunit family amidase n=1 Tax=Saccharothrix violaceirubra TaxID=413306 RepID=A0A7W7T5D7_9PSEU|nr:amidase family protein [Saccharothrix violaceirubra]MBB4966297.1 Asp-tRNA(Asn)/Glu-tRNA(Gln) amidotransferase A subunit family amidase [Saccharothrix violaceirubra]